MSIGTGTLLSRWFPAWSPIEFNVPDGANVQWCADCETFHCSAVLYPCHSGETAPDAVARFLVDEYVRDTTASEQRAGWRQI